MKVLIAGPNSWGSWRELEAILAVLTPQDEVVHNGSYDVGGKVDRILARAKRTRRPTVTVQFPETRYPEGDQRLEQNALQLVGAHRPDEIVLIYDDREPLPPELVHIVTMAGKYKQQCRWWEEFVDSRLQRESERGYAAAQLIMGLVDREAR